MPPVPPRRLRTDAHRRWANVLVVAAAGLVVAGVLASLFDVDVSKLTRDPAQIGGRHPLVGVVSNLGVLAWCAATVVCLVTWHGTRRGVPSALPASFLLWSGLVSAWFLVDDLFVVHEDLFPVRIGIPENVILAVDGLVLVAYLWHFRRSILATDWTPLAVAVGLGAMSLVLDVVEQDVTLGGSRLALPMHVLVEDGLKFLAVIAWAAYFWEVCLAELVDAASLRRPPEGSRSGARD